MPHKWFWVTLLVPVALLLSMTIHPLKISLFAEEIVIKTKPFDPRDLFYGDYVVLHYEIEDVPLDFIDREIISKAEEDPYAQLPVYVRLEKNGDIYEAKRVTAEKPQEGIYLKGIIHADSLLAESGGLAQVEYKNINRYYVEENTGHDLEEKARAGQIYAVLQVYEGDAILKDIR
jgi:uncharacterized membrane-anchored protein